MGSENTPEENLMVELYTFNLNGRYIKSLKERYGEQGAMNEFIKNYLILHESIISTNDKILKNNQTLYLNLKKEAWVDYNIVDSEHVFVAASSFIKIDEGIRLNKSSFLTMINSSSPVENLIALCHTN